MSPYEVAVKMAEMGAYPSGTPWGNQVIQTEGLRFLNVGSVVVRVRDGLAFQSQYYTREIYGTGPDRIEWSEADYNSRTWRTAEGMVEDFPDEWWVVAWHGQMCLMCGNFGTHKFVVIGGPDGWLCEEHKDDPIEHEGIVYGEMQRRVSADE